MQTDKNNTLRVTITIHRESSPEWFSLLLKTTSGRARAELVRQHLTLPRFAVPAENASPQAVKAAEPTVNSSPSIEINSSEPVLKTDIFVNSPDISSNKSTTYNEEKLSEKETVNNTKPVESGTINSNLENLPGAPRARGGMAAMVITVKNNE